MSGEARDRQASSACSGTGYKGRTAVFQIMDLNADVRTAIARGATRAEIRDAARRTGSWRPFREVALDKVLRGDTTVEEIVRIFAPE